MRIQTLLLCLLFACVSVSAYGQQAKPVNSVATIADLTARLPVVGEEIQVRNYSATVLWDQPRAFRNDATATNAHDGVHYLTNRSIAGRWVSADRLSPIQRVEWYGAYGAAKDGANLLNEQESQFTDLTRDAAWSGYGDARRVLTDPTGTNVSYGLASFPTSPSSGPYASMDGFLRAPGLANIPPNGTLSLRLTRRGHGYTNAQETVTVALNDGGGAPASYAVEIATGWADGYFNGGGLRLVSSASGGSGQTMVLSYYATTNAPFAGLRKPLVTGRTYNVSIAANHVSGTGTATNRQLWVGSSSSAAVTLTPNTVAATYTGTFVADDDDLRIGLVGSTSAGEAFLLDDIVVREGTIAADPSHEGDKIQAAIDWAVGGQVVFPANRKFVSTNGFILRGGQQIVGNGSSVEISITDGTRQDGFQILSDGCSIEGLEIEYSATAPDENGGEGAQQIIGLGHFQFEDYPSVRNIRLENLILKGYGASQWPQAINIGGASGVVVRNITIPDNAGLYQAIGVYWSGDLVQSIGTVHPQNVLIENVDIGRLTASGSGGNGANGITIAGSRNVLVRNFHARSVTGNFIRISGGDMNFQRAKAEDGGAGMAGITIDGATCLAIGRYGFRVQTLASYIATNAPIIGSNVVVTVDETNNRIVWPGGTNAAPDGALVVFSGTSAPSGITLGESYWVTWSGPAGFKLRDINDGSGNEEAIDLGAGATNLIATVRRGQEFQPLSVTARNIDIKSSNGTYDGIYPDGAQDIVVEKSRIRGFKAGFLPDYTAPNRRITLRDSVFTGNRGNGIQIRSGYDIAIERCVIEGNGIDDLSDDNNAGIWVRNGDRITIQGNQLGFPTGETTQRVGVKVENDNLDLRGITIRDNAFLSAYAAHHAELNAPSVAWPHTFNVVTGNKWFASTTTSNFWQATATLYSFPGLRAGDSEAQAIRFGSSLALDLLAQRVLIGADDSASMPGTFSRTDNTDKLTVFQAPPYATTNTPAQFLRVDSKANSTTVATYGIGGSDNRSTTKFLIGTAVSALPGAAITNIGVFDANHRIRLGPAGNEQTDATAGVALEGPLPLRIHRMTTAEKNALTKATGLLLFDTDANAPYWSDGVSWYEFGAGGGGGATNGTDVWIEGSQQTTFNLQDGSEIAGTKTGSNYTYSVVAGSLGTNKLTTAAYTSLVSRATHTGTQTASTISDFTAAAIAAAGLGWQPTNANLTTVASLTGGTSTNFHSGDGSFKQVTTNMVPGLNAALASSEPLNANKYQGTNAALTTLAAATGGNATNFYAGDGTFKQVTTNMIPGLVQALADGVASGGGGGAGAYTNTTGTGSYVLADSPTVSGNWVFDELTVGTFTVSTNLFSAEVAYGAGWNGSSNVPTRNAVYDEMELRAPKASPALTGDPTAPTAALNDNDTSIATTAYVRREITNLASGGGGGSTVTVNGSGTLTNIADGADITLATSGGTTATPTLTDTGVTNGTYTLSANGNTATVDAKGRITAIENLDDVNDFDLVDEFVGPSTYTLFNPAANSGSTAAGGVSTTLTNLLGTRWIMTSGSNQYPILVCSAPFKNAGMQYVQLAMRFYFPLLSTDADPWEFQMGIYDAATTTNRPANGSWITGNTNLGTANFYLCNGTNSTYNFVDTGITMTATNWHDWAVRMTPSNSIAFYRSAPVATNALNYPTSTYMSVWAIRMSRFAHTAAAQRFIYVDNGRIKFRSGPGR